MRVAKTVRRGLRRWFARCDHARHQRSPATLSERPSRRQASTQAVSGRARPDKSKGVKRQSAPARPQGSQRSRRASQLEGSHQRVVDLKRGMLRDSYGFRARLVRVVASTEKVTARTPGAVAHLGTQSLGLARPPQEPTSRTTHRTADYATDEVTSNVKVMPPSALRRDITRSRQRGLQGGINGRTNLATT